MSFTLASSPSGERAYVKPELGEVLSALDKINREPSSEKWKSFSVCLGRYLNTEEKIVQLVRQIFKENFCRMEKEEPGDLIKRFLNAVSTQNKGSELIETLCRLAEVHEITKLARENERLKHELALAKQPAISAAGENLSALVNGHYT